MAYIKPPETLPQADPTPPDNFETPSRKSMSMTCRTLSPSMEPIVVDCEDHDVVPLRIDMPVEDCAVTDTSALEPSTPETKAFAPEWYGLPTPGSPNFPSQHDDQNGECASVVSEITIADDVAVKSSEHDVKHVLCDMKGEDQISPIIHDCIAVEVPCNAQEDVPVAKPRRRSARVMQNSKPKVPDPVKPTPKPTFKPPVKPTPKPSKPEEILPFETSSPPESSLNQEAFAPIAIERELEFLSSGWQLCYPPGGSTHPYYPYPEAEARLLFNPNVVPMVGGLPDISRVPPLFLPIGWVHVSWSGLNPIVFDPYHQAFKLTPVGPLPLTNEELQQGGLHKYTPGGICHPETALLPDIAQLGDGSMGDDIDMEGADWVLPSLQSGTPFTTNRSKSTAGVGFLASLYSSNGSPSTEIPVYDERRDCPDQVYDLEEAWRWLEERQRGTYAAFEPTASKQWHRSGFVRSNRKLKSPIGELMMSAIADNSAYGLSLLENQDNRSDRGKNMFCPFKSVATPVGVNITLLADTEFTIFELVCCFPQHLHWRKATERFSHAGVTPSSLRMMLNMSRKLRGEASLKRETVSSQMFAAKKRPLRPNAPENGGDADKESTTSHYTAEGWYYDGCTMIDYPVLALAHGVQHLPTGSDAGPLTALIQWCRVNSRFKALLSDVPALLEEAGISPLIESGDSGCPDKEVWARHSAAAKEDHKKVLQSLQAMEGDGGDGEERGAKRKRAT